MLSEQKICNFNQITGSSLAMPAFFNYARMAFSTVTLMVINSSQQYISTVCLQRFHILPFPELCNCAFGRFIIFKLNYLSFFDPSLPKKLFKSDTFLLSYQTAPYLPLSASHWRQGFGHWIW